MIVRRPPVHRHHVPLVPKPKIVFTLPPPEVVQARIEDAAEKHGIKPHEVLLPTRKRAIAWARQDMLAGLVRDYKLPLSAASRFFGYDRDTIRHALKQSLIRETTTKLKKSGYL